ncbi:MAG: MBL fold metallo-hydrolase [Nanoarchaeota archaeon]
MRYKNIQLHWLSHAGFKIKLVAEEKIIYIDPFQLQGEQEKADFLFITHAHYDHCSIEDIKKIIKSDTIVICSIDVQSKIAKASDNVNIRIVHPAKEYKLNHIVFKTIPAYTPKKNFHPKENDWVGYLLTVGETTLYHAGDTDFIPEMKTIQTNIALLPVGGTYTMNAYEAIQAAITIKPQLAIPMHWGSIVGSKEDAHIFVDGCKEEGINAEMLERE